MRPFVRSIASAATTVVAAGAAGQDFRDLPDIACREPSVWRHLVNQGRFGVTNAIMLGDSQETCPQGWGDIYLPALSAEFARFYGGCGMTPWCQAGQAFGGGAPWAEWLVRGAAAPRNMTMLDGARTWITPGLRVAITSIAGGRNVNHDQEFGWLLTLDACAEWSNPGAEAAGSWFDASGVDFEIAAVTNPGSSELYIRFTTTTGGPSYYGSPIRVETTTMGLDAPQGAVRTQRFGPFFPPAGSKLQAEVFGRDPSRTARVLSGRFISNAAPRGLVITDLAEGGYQASDVLRIHSDCGGMIAAMRPDVAFLTFGANEVRNGTPLTRYRSSLRELIRYVRLNTRRDLPIVIMPDVLQRTWDAYNEKTMDDLSSVGFELALEDPWTLFVNSRRLTDAQGWDAAGAWRFLADGVHYTPLGGRTKARVEAEAILGSFGCGVDLTDDGFVDFFDYDRFIEEFEGGRDEGDFNRDGFIDFFDYDSFIEAFERGC